MNIKKLLVDRRAVSPVIGVILMVAITVILAAVIGTFVLGLGDQVQTTAPQASFQFEYSNSTTGNGDSLTISHAGGDTISASNIKFSATGAKGGTYGSGDTMSGTSLTTSKWSALSTGDVKAGNSVSLTKSEFGTSDLLKLDQATVTVSWQSTQGDSSATLGTWNGPNA